MYEDTYRNWGDNVMNQNKKDEKKNSGAGLVATVLVLVLGIGGDLISEIVRFIRRGIRIKDKLENFSIPEGLDIPAEETTMVLFGALVLVIFFLVVVKTRRKLREMNSHNTFHSAARERTIHHNLDLAKQTGKINLNGTLYSKEELKQLHL
jgi:hypothetical protein